MRTIMGIDQSLTGTGVVVTESHYHATTGQWVHGTVLHHEVIATQRMCEDFVMDTLLRAEHIADRLMQLCADHHPDEIVFETPSLASKGNATRTLPMLLGVLLSRLKGQGYTHHVAPSSLKKFATNNGAASKPKMFEALQDADPALGFQMRTEYPKTKGLYDVTDAYWLAQYAQKKLIPEEA